MRPFFRMLPVLSLFPLAAAAQAQAQAQGAECGTQGTVAERVADCREKLGRFAESCVWRGPWTPRPGFAGQMAFAERPIECDKVVLRTRDAYRSLNATVSRWYLVTRLKAGHEVWLSERRDTHHRKHVIWSEASADLTFEEAKSFCEDPTKGQAEKGNLPLAFAMPTRDGKYCGSTIGGRCSYARLGAWELPHDPFRAELDYAFTSGMRSALPKGFADRMLWADDSRSEGRAWLLHGTLNPDDVEELEMPQGVAVEKRGSQARHPVRCYALYEAPVPEAPQACKELQLRKVPEGTRCATSRGVGFELIKRSSTGKEVWKDLKTGLLWSDLLGEVSPFNHCQAARAQDAWAGLRSALFVVPTLVDYREAEAHGFREVLPNMVPGSWGNLFKVDVLHHDEGQRYLFSGETGKIVEMPQAFVPGVRCVGL